ncbi:hypothetical protein ACKWTF_007713 [Chironomus riparius]
MEVKLSQNSVRELMNSSAINAVKLLTSNQAMKETYFIKISDVPNRLKLYDIVMNLQKTFKLNFITNIHRCNSTNNIHSVLIGCRNAAEVRAFISHGDAIMIKGYRLKIEESKRPVGVNLVKVPEELKKEVKHLSRVMSFKAAYSYSKVFPSERIIEILLEMEADAWILSGLKGIWLKYIHHERKLDDKVIISVDEIVGFNAISRFLVEYGNSETKNRSSRIIMTYKCLWQRENIYEINEEEDAIYSLTPDLLQKDMLTKGNNFNNIRGVME